MFFPSCLTAAGALPRAAVAVAALTCAAPAFAHFPPPTPPATVYYGTLTAAEEAEVQAWGIAYWTRVEAGTHSTMTFSTAAMNSHLFNPFRGTRATLESFMLLEEGDCDKAIAEGSTSAMDAATLAKRQALKDAMTAAKLATDPVTNPDGTIEHITQIMDAAAASEFVTYEEGGKLVSLKLPLDVIVAAGADPDLATELSADTVNAINALTVAAPGYASSSTGCTEAQKLLNGGTSKSDQVEQRVRTLIRDLGVAGDTDQQEAAFGVYGSLPLLVVAFPDCFVLLDVATGATSSPFKPGEQVDARVLLAGHTEYSAGTGARVYSSTGGCLAVAAADWHDLMPTATPLTCYTKMTRPGISPTDWTCTTMMPTPVNRFTNPFPSITVACWCEQDVVWVWNKSCGPKPPAGMSAFVRVREVCKYMGACNAPREQPSVPGPLLPSGGGPFPTVTPFCKSYYWF